MARRGLSAEDRAIWARVTDSVTPLPRRRRSEESLLPPMDNLPTGGADRSGPGAATGRVEVAVLPAPLPAFRIGERVGTGGSRATRLPAPPAVVPRMDAGQFRRLSRGRLAPDARIDLHGLTLQEAHGALTGFVLRSQAKGARLLLVITGKGRRAEGEAPFARVGALRQDVPRWLRLPPLAPLVLDVVPAHRRHGGDGAVYVYLRS